METANLFAFALLLAACHEEPTMTFGLKLRVLDSDRPPEQEQTMCRPPGEYGGSTVGVSIDKWDIGEPAPHLFLESDPDAEENIYRVRVYTAVDHEEGGGVWWEPSEILAERSYDSGFGEGGEQDSFVVNFEEQPYTVEVQGLPSLATCP
jgi:hypothetical protein